MNCYFDTCRLQELAKKDSTHPLKKFFMEKNGRIIIMYDCVYEVVRQKKRSAIQDVGSFLDAVNYSYLVDQRIALKNELLMCFDDSRHYDFLTKKFSLSGFYTSDLETCMHTNSLSINALLLQLNKADCYAKQKIPDYNRAHKWMKQFEKINAEINHDYNSVEYWKSVDYMFNDKLQRYIVDNDICIEKYAKNYDKIKKVDVPSFSIPFYVQHLRQSNVKRSWGENEMWDITQCRAIPYVDFFFTDNDNTVMAKRALTKLGLDKYAKRVVNSLDEVKPDCGDLNKIK